MGKDGGCLVVILAFFCVIALIFLLPLVVQHAWNIIAVQEFGAPALDYWQCFFGSWALRYLFKGSAGSNSDSIKRLIND